MITLTEMKYAISDIVLETSKLLKTPSPKVVFETKNNEDVYCEYGINEIYINEDCLDLDNLFNTMSKLFSIMYYNYAQNVTKEFYYLENEDVVKLWKNELIKKLMFDDTEMLQLNIDISCKAFSYLMIEKFFNINQDIPINIKSRYDELKMRYAIKK